MALSPVFGRSSSVVRLHMGLLGGISSGMISGGGKPELGRVGLRRFDDLLGVHFVSLHYRLE